LLLASLLQAFYGSRSEQLPLEQLDDLLFRWLVGLSPDDPIWDPTRFTHNRERLSNEQVLTERSGVGRRPLDRFLEMLMEAPEKMARGIPKATAEGRGSATPPTAPVRIPSLGWPAHQTITLSIPAIRGTCRWTTTMPWWCSVG
jgi:hypothetical protein